MYDKVCKICGKAFTSEYPKTAFCSTDCRKVVYRDREPRAGKDRELTDMTPYLCQKWKREGMGVAKIAAILNRTTASVDKALSVKLSRGQEAEIEEYLRHKRRISPKWADMLDAAERNALTGKGKDDDEKTELS